MTELDRGLRLRVVQVAYGDDEPVAARLERVAAVVRAQRGADLVVLPELWAHGGFAADQWVERAEPLSGAFVTAMSEAARDAGVVLHAGSFIERSGAPEPLRGRSNTSVVLGHDGQVLAVYRKVHRFGFAGGEPLLLDAGEELATVALAQGTLGLSTCYDLRFPELYRALLDRGADAFVVPAAWPEPRVEHWRLLGRARAVENQCFVVQCNTAGEHSGHRMGGYSQVISPIGDVLAVAGGTGSEEVLDVEIDLAEVERLRRTFPVHADRRLPPHGPSTAADSRSTCAA